MRVQEAIRSLLVEAMLTESRKQDLDAIQKAEELFDSILSYLKGLRDDPKLFARAFNTDPETGRLSVLQDKPFLPDMLTVAFVDREAAGVKREIKARARRRQKALSGRLTRLEVVLYVDSPEGANKTPRAYNAWLAKNLVRVLEGGGYRSSFVHEFVHTLDFRRMSPDFLLRRTRRPKPEKKDFSLYVNDPVETNAFFSQALADALRSTPSNASLTPAEFADLVLDSLRPQAKKYLSPANRKKMMARAATAWELKNKGV